MGPDEDLEGLMRKYSNGKNERDFTEYYTELYACLKTLEKLERAYSRGMFATAVAKAEYEAHCKSLITQCRLNHDPIRQQFPNLTRFADTYLISCHRALNRMTRGIPATLEHFDGAAGPTDRRPAADVQNATEAIINFLDALRMDVAPEVERLTDPLFHTLNCLTKVDYLVPNLKEREKLVKWSATMSAMRAVDLLDEDQRRQMMLDTESVYREFKFRIENT